MKALSGFVRANRRVAGGLEAAHPKIFCDDSYVEVLLDRINGAIGATRPQTVIEAGGVDRPLLGRGRGYEFVGIDIDDRPDCANVYDRFIVQSVEQPLPLKADMIVSITLLEHVPDNEATMRSFFDALNAGGTTHHYCPSKWHPYSIALRLVGPKLQKILIRHLRPEAEAVTGYPAFFDYCTPGSMERLMKGIGFRDVSVRSFYSAADYFAFLLPAYFAVVGFEKICKLLGLRVFASGFVISGVKSV